MNISILLLFHAIITFAAAIVLVVAPGLIPRTLGITLDPSNYLLCYLLAGAELSIAFLSYFGRKLQDTHSLRLIVLTIIVFHVSTFIFEIYAIMQGVNTLLWVNVAFRAVIVALLAYYGLYKLKMKR